MKDLKLTINVITNYVINNKRKGITEGRLRGVVRDHIPLEGQRVWRQWPSQTSSNWLV